MEEIAHRRIESFYRQLFPELFNTTTTTIHPTNVSNSDCLSDEEVHHGWESQPKEFDYEVEVTGKIPKELQGTLFRNGPGLLEVYGTPLVHPIDGDGMICSLSLHNGKAHFKSSYVKTNAYIQEFKEKRCMFRGMMGTNPPNSNTFIPKFKNPSNTNAYVWGGKLLSVWESGWPYVLDPATLETIGRDNLDGAINDARCVAAHFRYDHLTNRLVTLSLRIDDDGKGSHVWFHEFDPSFKLVKQQVHYFDKYYYCHDLALTPDYYIIHQSPYYNVTNENISKIAGVNAYEEDSKLNFASVCFEGDFRMEFTDKALILQKHLNNATVSPGQVYKTVIDLKNNNCARAKVDNCSCEFPTTHPFINGEKWRYAYLMAADSPHKAVPYQDIIKFDLLSENRQVWSARSERGIIGEPVFVPRISAPLTTGVKEDEGWVITQLYLAQDHKTQFVILDAQDLARGPIARLHLKHHVPYLLLTNQLRFASPKMENPNKGNNQNFGVSVVK